MGTPKPCSLYLIGPRDHRLDTFVFINALRKITYRRLFWGPLHKDVEFSEIKTFQKQINL